MNIKEHTTPERLEKYSFFWSEARLVVAAVALFLGGVPPILLIIPIPLVKAGLTICWVISGGVSAYLAYRWYTSGQKVFGGKNKLDLAAFFVNVVTGFNLGIAGLLGINIGMTISSNKIVFILAGLVYLATAYLLWNRWSKSGKKLFF